MAKTVLIVDDSLFMREMIREALEEGDYEIVGEAANGEDAIELAIEHNPDIITLDNVLPDISGIEILQVFKEEGVTSAVIMISGVGQDSIIQEGINLGAIDYLVKPFTPEDLIAALEKV